MTKASLTRVRLQLGSTSTVIRLFIIVGREAFVIRRVAFELVILFNPSSGGRSNVALRTLARLANLVAGVALVLALRAGAGMTEASLTRVRLQLGSTGTHLRVFCLVRFVVAILIGT